MTIHKLKLNAAYYDDSASGIKTFEIRKNDRDFKVGDILELREYVWSNVEKRGAYTGAGAENGDGDDGLVRGI